MPKVFQNVSAAISEIESISPASGETIQAALLLALHEIGKLNGEIPAKPKTAIKRMAPQDRPSALDLATKTARD